MESGGEKKRELARVWPLVGWVPFRCHRVWTVQTHSLLGHLSMTPAALLTATALQCCQHVLTPNSLHADALSGTISCCTRGTPMRAFSIAQDHLECQFPTWGRTKASHTDDKPEKFDCRLVQFFSFSIPLFWLGLGIRLCDQGCFTTSLWPCHIRDFCVTSASPPCTVKNAAKVRSRRVLTSWAWERTDVATSPQWGIFLFKAAQN